MQSQHIVKNRILGQLSADELKSVQPWLTPLELRSNVVLHEPGDAMERVYFPLSGMISLLAVMQTGEAIETGIAIAQPPRDQGGSGHGNKNFSLLNFVPKISQDNKISRDKVTTEYQCLGQSKTRPERFYPGGVLRSIRGRATSIRALDTTWRSFS